ncbi:uncharacterized protein BDV17DRAFT_249718 [Aspergillus undulatus]|uniref:uncharacterized protein n=1 Tax=Aspergillus undulatus TaxID=1810928 RepID=UPI003CCCD414
MFVYDLFLVSLRMTNENKCGILGDIAVSTPIYAIHPFLFRYLAIQTSCPCPIAVIILLRAVTLVHLVSNLLGILPLTFCWQ